jgi:hypothetical protein
MKIPCGRFLVNIRFGSECLNTRPEWPRSQLHEVVIRGYTQKVSAASNEAFLGRNETHGEEFSIIRYQKSDDLAGWSCDNYFLFSLQSYIGS